MTDPALEYYERRYGKDVQAVFVHAVRELGELARAIERDQPALAVIEITEVAALARYLAHVYGFDLDAGIADFYGKKLRKLEKS